MRGWHLIGLAGLSELEEQVVLGVCHTGDGYETMKSELMRIFGERREKEEIGWMGGGEKRNRMGQGRKKDVSCVGRRGTEPGIVKIEEEGTKVLLLPKDRAHGQGMSHKGRRDEILEMWDKR